MTPFREARHLSRKPGEVWLQLDDGWRARVMLPAGCDGRVGRFSMLPPGGWREPRTWALDPTGAFALQGRLRDELFTADAQAGVTDTAGGLLLGSAHLRAAITLQPFGVAWQQCTEDGRWVDCCADRPSYAVGHSPRSGTISHWQGRDANDRYFGLGDKTGPLNLHGRRLRTRQLDALGYDAQTGDPLYKHWPFLLTHRADTGTAFGLYWDTLAECTFDLGCEHDNYHGLYRATEVADGDLDQYIFAGPTLDAALARYVAAIGGTAMPPRWTLGYANTAMALADHPDAQARIGDFLQRAVDDGFPLSSFHFGSGYTSRGKRRYVFTWNRDKFPEPQALLQRFADAGVRTVANLKPCLLDDHPAYAALAEGGAFIRHQGVDGQPGQPCLEQFWDGWGAHLDFTREGDRRWWQQGLQQQILDFGIDVGWNDNNEYVIWAEDAASHAGGKPATGASGGQTTPAAAPANPLPQPLPLHRGRPLQALLMTRATFDQQAAAKPAERVYTITRAGSPGIQRYAQTWTGDNTTSWHTLRWNQRMALTMGLSGLFNVGHDIGGFFGPVPDAELLIRWTQACCLLPRMIMNSWKADGSVNTPWLHAEATAPIRAAVGLRLQLMPYLYTQLWRACTEHRPMLRPTFLDFGAADPATFDDCDEFMVGPDLLVAPVLDPGASSRRLYLPKHPGGWFDWATGAHHAGGQWVTLDAPLDRLPLLVRAGALLPTTDGRSDAARTEEPSRVLRWYVAPAGQGDAAVDHGLLWEDDGLSASPAAAGGTLHRLQGRADDQGGLHLQHRCDGPGRLPAGLPLWLPPAERRPLRTRPDGWVLAGGV